MHGILSVCMHEYAFSITVPKKKKATAPLKKKQHENAFSSGGHTLVYTYVYAHTYTHVYSVMGA